MVYSVRAIDFFMIKRLLQFWVIRIFLIFTSVRLPMLLPDLQRQKSSAISHESSTPHGRRTTQMQVVWNRPNQDSNRLLSARQKMRKETISYSESSVCVNKQIFQRCQWEFTSLKYVHLRQEFKTYKIF